MASETDRPGESCEGCGSLLDLTDQQISQAVEDVLESTIREARELRGTCPLCGRAATPAPLSHRKSIQFGLLVLLLLLTGAIGLTWYVRHDTERRQALREAMERVIADDDVSRLLGSPITAGGPLTGAVKVDETGWHEVTLTTTIQGSRSSGSLTVRGGRQEGPWTFSTIEIVLPTLHQRVDVLARRIVRTDPDAYVDTHTEIALSPEFSDQPPPSPGRDGDFPCLRVSAGPSARDQVTRCADPWLHWGEDDRDSVDGFDVDLRFGKFILRQTDHVLRNAEVRIPFVRTYTSRFSIHPSPDQAFGRNCTHRFDIAPVGSRNPYRDLYLVLPDGDFVHFDRMSKGTGYADAVYRHTETSSRFYGSLTRWNGNGWDVFLRDGSLIRFPESYHARNMAQGAATEIVDARSNRIDLERDGQRNLKEIRIAGGRWLRLTHDADGRIVRADDDGGRWTTYDYAGGLLTRVRHSDGTGQDYVYRGDLLTVVRDQHGRDVIRNDYRDSMLVSQEIAGGKRYRFHYTMAPNRAYAVEATVETDDGRIRSIPTAASVSPTLVALRPDDPR